MRLIDADAMMRDIGETVIFSVRPDRPSAELRGARKVVDRIEAAPTVDAVEVKHGRWIRYKENCLYNRCSRCLYEHCREPNYCPNCGAKMDGDEDEY